MKFQIDGVGTLNRGAELMFYSILEQIEIKAPDSTVIFNSTSIGKDKINTKLKIIKPTRLKYTSYLRAIIFKLKLPIVYFSNMYPISEVNVVFDASGFKYGDQWSHNDVFYKHLEHYYKTLKAYNTKIILLPQAFGPFEKSVSKKVIDILNKYVDIIISRDSTSLSHLINAGIDIGKVSQYPDFTCLLKGVFPIKYEALKNAVCIIPNHKMLTHTGYSKDQYLNFYDIIIPELAKKHKVFLLNHEGIKDLQLCEEIANKLKFKIPIVSNISAKEIKGVINESKLVISSRFHGVVSALTQAIPCISTSWSHKYELLMKEYGFENYVLDINSNPGTIIKLINDVLIPENQKKMRSQLHAKSLEIKEQVENMWNYIWSEID